ncbi:MAG: hypothetical protein PVJ39_13415 [Gammaproteobacteria bacterium]|jgi:hypothetical protein
MANRTDRLIDKLKLEHLNVKTLKKIIDFSEAPHRDWSLNDQLDAIHLMGYTASEEALHYLQYIYEPSIIVKQRIEWRTEFGMSTKDVNLVQTYQYPNARGPLAEALCYEVPLFTSAKQHLKQLKPVADLKTEQQDIFRKSAAHSTLRKALDCLERSIVSWQD